MAHAQASVAASRAVRKKIYQHDQILLAQAPNKEGAALIPPRSRRVADLVIRLETHQGELAAIQHTHAPGGGGDQEIVAEYYARTSFRIALEHQSQRLRVMERLAGIIYAAVAVHP